MNCLDYDLYNGVHVRKCTEFVVEVLYCTVDLNFDAKTLYLI